MKFRTTVGFWRWNAPARRPGKYAEAEFTWGTVEVHRALGPFPPAGPRVESWEFRPVSGRVLTLHDAGSPGHDLHERAERGITVEYAGRTGTLAAQKSVKVSERRVTLHIGEDGLALRRIGGRTVVVDRSGTELATRRLGRWELARPSEPLQLFLTVLAAADLEGHLGSPLWGYLSELF
ncbi:hypothetical protein ACIA8O_39150 [Kitasatospora sp. NPDC051853]|uniref:hypothetical protein n=1 Tax=Kitasatospora sp. NPDC051853 TaxID=3364058 RepID=UPI0037B0E071